MDEAMQEKCKAFDKIVDAHARQLSEHFDCVHIFCMFHEGDDKGGTFRTSKGFGNYFSRYGQIKHWIIGEEAATQAEEMKGDD